MGVDKKGKKESESERVSVRLSELTSKWVEEKKKGSERIEGS